MEYNDFLLPGQAEFEKLAKAYSSIKKCAKESEISASLIDSIAYSLKYLTWLYGYIKKNIRINKIKIIFENLSKQTELDFIAFENKFIDEQKNYKLTKNRKLNNISSCLKLAFYTESELLINMMNLFIFDEEFFLPIILNHLENIKKLSSF